MASRAGLICREAGGGRSYHEVYRTKKIKKARRLGIALSPKSERWLLERRPNPPGQHGPNRRRGKQSDYGKQLTEKQRLRYQYNLSEKRLRGVYTKASRKPGNTGEVMLQMLESRFGCGGLACGDGSLHFPGTSDGFACAFPREW